MSETAAVREALPGLLRDLKVRSMLDAPCGDFNWMRSINLDLDLYVGGDIVPEIIADVRAKDGAPGREFAVLDLIADNLPKVDLILCRDCLVHLSMANIRRALDNFRRSGSTWLLTTRLPRHDEEPGHHQRRVAVVDLQLRRSRSRQRPKSSTSARTATRARQIRDSGGSPTSRPDCFAFLSPRPQP
jgi:hypothetical protein